MCLAVPGRIVSIDEQQGSRIASVDFGTAERSVDLVFVPHADVGAWVIVHSGFGLRTMSADDAAATYELLDSLPPPMSGAP